MGKAAVGTVRGMEKFLIAADECIRKFAAIPRDAARRIGAWIAVCVLIVWIGTGALFDHRAREAFKEESSRAGANLENISSQLLQTVQRLRGFASIIAQDESTKELLTRLRADRPHGQTGVAAANSPLKLNRYLATAAGTLPADLIWVVDASGTAVASSNADTASSLVGDNFADRQYFRAAKAGRPGQQFAIGRHTGIARLYFSFPVFEGKTFLGATIIKWNVPQLSTIFSENVFVADETGVIIASSHNDWLFRAVRDGASNRLSTQETQSRYGRAAIDRLRVDRRNDGSFPGLVTIDGNPHPLILVSKPLPSASITVYVAHPFDQLLAFTGERVILFAIVSLGCMLAVFAASAGWHLLHSMRRESESAERTIRAQIEIQERIEVEQKLAKSILEGAVMGPNVRPPALTIHLAPATTFNGDLLLTAYTPSGDLHVLVGDFTGHGLVATIGALPAAEIFRAMTAKNFRPPEILAEINDKLRTVLPTGRFLAATFVRIEHNLQKVSAINCGMPPAWLIKGEQPAPLFKSCALPLAILPGSRYQNSEITVETSCGDRVFVASDGATEAMNRENSIFGLERIGAAIARGLATSQPVAEVTRAMAEFCGEMQLVDDATLVDIHLVPQLFAPAELPRADGASFTATGEDMNGVAAGHAKSNGEKLARLEAA